jgi:hypothetical protein
MAKKDLSIDRLAVRLLIGISAGLALLFLTELAIDLSRSNVPWSELAASARAGQAMASCVSRAMNNLTAMVLTFIALAVPITANMYTPKLVEIFIRDRINLCAVVFFASMGAHALFAQGMMFDQWAPLTLYTVTWLSGVVGFAVLIPYYFYVLAFLNPVTIIRRVTDLIFREFDEIAAGVRPMPEARKRLDQEILNLGNVILRAIDRTDRDVSLDAIHALQRTVMRYGDISKKLPDAWFEVERDLFTGHSRDAIGVIVKERIWVEQKCLHQLMLAYTASLAKMPDAISAVSSVMRRIALHAKMDGHDQLLALSVRYFNTYLREAVKKKDVHAIYDVYSQYSFLAKELLTDRPAVALAIARHFKYYAEFARWQGMQFIYELAAFDLVTIVEAAYESKAACRGELLDVFLSFEGDKNALRLTKSQIVLAAFLADLSLAPESARVADAIQRAGAEQIEAARRDLTSTEDPVFWEVTDRQINLDFVVPERRASVARVLEEAAARKRTGQGPSTAE